MFNYIEKEMNQELEKDRAEVNKNLDKKYGQMEYVGTQEEIAKAKADMETKRQRDFEEEMKKREETRKQLHFPDESYDEVKERLETQERQRQEQARIKDEQAEQQRKAQELQQQQTEKIREQESARKQKELEEQKRQKEEAQKAAEQAKSEKEQRSKEQFQTEYSRINPGQTTSMQNAPVEESQAKEELTHEEKMADYDRRMREHFERSSSQGREEDVDRGR